MCVGRLVHWTATALAGALALCGLAAGDISFPDIVGNYNLQKGNLEFCAATAAVAVGAATLPGNALSFGGAECSGSLGFTLAESDGLPHWTAAARAAGGIVLAPAKGSVNLVTCPGATIGIPDMMFMRPNQRFELAVAGYAKPIVLDAGVRYWIPSSGAGGCVYRHAASAPSPSPSAPPPNAAANSAPANSAPANSAPANSAPANSAPANSAPTKGDPRQDSTGGQGGGGGSGGDGLNIWVWLGPVLGAAATMAAALVTVFRCSRRDGGDKAAPPPGSEGAPAHSAAGGAPSFAPPPAWAPAYP